MEAKLCRSGWGCNWLRKWIGARLWAYLSFVTRDQLGWIKQYHVRSDCLEIAFVSQMEDLSAKPIQFDCFFCLVERTRTHLVECIGYTWERWWPLKIWDVSEGGHIDWKKLIQFNEVWHALCAFGHKRGNVIWNLGHQWQMQFLWYNPYCLVKHDWCPNVSHNMMREKSISRASYWQQRKKYIIQYIP